MDPKGLQSNGGQTQTIALLASSPAVNAIPLSPTNYCTAVDGVTPIITDQRGVTRPQGSGCDIGAFTYETPAQAIQTVINLVNSLALPNGTRQPLLSSLQVVLTSLNTGNNNVAVAQLYQFLNQINVFEANGKLTLPQRAQLTVWIQSIIQGLGG